MAMRSGLFRMLALLAALLVPACAGDPGATTELGDVDLASAIQQTLSEPGLELTMLMTTEVAGQRVEVTSTGVTSADGRTGRMAMEFDGPGLAGDGEFVLVDGMQYLRGLAQQAYIAAGADPDATWIVTPIPDAMAMMANDNPLQGLESLQALADASTTSVQREMGTLDGESVTILTATVPAAEMLGDSVTLRDVLEMQPGSDQLPDAMIDEMTAWFEEHAYEITVWIREDQSIARMVSTIDMGSLMSQFSGQSGDISMLLTVDMRMSPLDAMPLIVAPTDDVVPF